MTITATATAALESSIYWGLADDFAYRTQTIHDRREVSVIAADITSLLIETGAYGPGLSIHLETEQTGHPRPDLAQREIGLRFCLTEEWPDLRRVTSTVVKLEDLHADGEPDRGAAGLRNLAKHLHRHLETLHAALDG